MAESKYIEIEEKFQEKIAEILNALNLSATIIVDTIEVEDRKYLKVDLEGEELSVLIGHHGKTLSAMRTVLGLIAPSVDDAQFGVLLDVNHYHAKREDYIRKLASSVAEQVKLTMQPMEMMPMTPAERRIVHLTLQEDTELETESVGEDQDRRVVVKLKQ